MRGRSLTIRNPMEVAQSLGKRDRFLSGKSHLIWLRHVLDAEASTRGTKRVIVTYDEVLADWRRTLERVADELEIVWPLAVDQIEGRVGRFLSTEHRHSRRSTEELASDPVARTWVAESYAALLALRDEPASTPVFDILDATRAEFANSLSILTPVYREADDELTARASGLAEREQQIEFRDQLLAEAQAKLNIVTSERDKAMIKNNLYENSLSWRITKPIREIKRVSSALMIRLGLGRTRD